MCELLFSHMSYIVSCEWVHASVVPGIFQLVHVCHTGHCVNVKFVCSQALWPGFHPPTPALGGLDLYEQTDGEVCFSSHGGQAQTQDGRYVCACVLVGGGSGSLCPDGK